MIRAWLTGRRDPFASPYREVSESGSATYYLPSNLGQDAPFTVVVNAVWEPSSRGNGDRVLPFLAGEGAKVTRGFSVINVDAAKDALIDTFKRMRGYQIPEVGAILISAAPEVRTDDHYRAFAQQKETLRLQALVHDEELKTKQAQLTRTRDMFLRDSAMAGLWWSQGQPDRLLELAAHKEKFGSVVSLLDGTAARNAEADRTGELINVFLADLRPEHREYLLGQLAQIFTGYGRQDLANQLGGAILSLPSPGAAHGTMVVGR